MFFKNISCLVLGVFLFTAALHAYPADVENISSSEYFDTVLTEISGAATSIDICMYLISFYPSQPDSKVAQLLEALAKAGERGVRVKVILDRGIEDANHNAYLFLKEKGISVFYDEPSVYTHSKVMVIDAETVILGSANWSKAALTQNHEAGILVRSEKLAREILGDLSQIKLSNVEVSTLKVVDIPQHFLSDQTLLGRMVEKSDERAFDTYLYLLKESKERGVLSVALDADLLARSLGIESMGREAYRRQIAKTLSKLRDIYDLIEFEMPYNQNALVQLKDLRSRTFPVDSRFWDHGWHRSLSFPAKVMYLVIAANTQATPAWFMSRKAIAERYHFSEDFITQGAQELRRLNLLEITYGEMTDYENRAANVYAPKPLYDPAVLANELKNLEAAYGTQKFTRARDAAAVVFEENSPRILLALIELENIHGRAAVSQAASKLAAKKSDNPKRSAGYLINTIKALGRE